MDKRRIKWTRQPGHAIYGEELRLPSLGINVTRSDPSAMAIPASWGTAELAVDSGDALSVSYLHHLKGEVTPVDREFEGVDPSFLRRVLLRVLDGEEYEEVRDYHEARSSFKIEPGVSEEKGVPWSRLVGRSEEPEPVAQVRVTDLRLAKDLTPRALERELQPALPALPVPVTSDGVMRWKHKTLRKPKGSRKPTELGEKQEWYQEEVTRITSISFAAAALCLFLDLEMADVEEIDRGVLAKRIYDLAELIRELTTYLDKSVERLSTLMRASKGGRPPDPDIKYYTALVLYRMGLPYFRVAQRIGLNPIIPRQLIKSEVYDDEPPVSKNWKEELRRAIDKGIEVERERFPDAVEVFTRREDEVVKKNALEAYHEYRVGNSWVKVADHLLHFNDGDDLLLTPRNKDNQVGSALIQLGSCIEAGRDPLHPTLA